MEVSIKFRKKQTDNSDGKALPKWAVLTFDFTKPGESMRLNKMCKSSEAYKLVSNQFIEGLRIDHLEVWQVQSLTVLTARFGNKALECYEACGLDMDKTVQALSKSLNLDGVE